MSTSPARSSAGSVEAKRRPAGLGQVQRLDAEAVAREHEPAAVALGDGEGEHALEAIDAALPPAAVGLEHDLGVAVGEEAQPGGLELAPQLAVVVDAAVEDDRQPELGVDHRLRAALGEVDDPQPPVAQGDARRAPTPRGRPGRAAPGRRPSGRPGRRRRRRRTTARPAIPHTAQVPSDRTSADASSTPRRAAAARTSAAKSVACGVSWTSDSACHCTPSGEVLSASVSTASMTPSGDHATACSPVPTPLAPPGGGRS